VTRTVRNYVDGVVNGAAPDEDVTVDFSYTADGKLATLAAITPTSDQVTYFVYGTTLDDSGVARSDLLRAEIYPDSDDSETPLGDGYDGVYDRVEYTYNRQGLPSSKKDQNETVHTYHYDGLLRLDRDWVTAVGPGVDGRVQRITISYNARGLPETITSADAENLVVNQVRLVYNAFGLLTTDYQEHAGAVNLSTSPQVGYTYSDGTAGHVRRTRMVYPNGRVLRYEYRPGADEQLNRVSFLADDAAGTVGTHLVEYQRLGLNTFVQTDIPSRACAATWPTARARTRTPAWTRSIGLSTGAGGTHRPASTWSASSTVTTSPATACGASARWPKPTESILMNSTATTASTSSSPSTAAT
jgi:hypothetical protein